MGLCKRETAIILGSALIIIGVTATAVGNHLRHVEEKRLISMSCLDSVETPWNWLNLNNLKR